MKLFDEIDRQDERPARYAEPQFTYLNRSARVIFSRTRQVLEAWFSRYPVSERPDLRARFRSKKDQQHHAAFFELFLHELLLQLGCSVTIHPSPGETTTRRPDFVAESPSGSRFYIEAVVVTGESEKNAAATARMNVVYDALDRLDSPNFFIGVELRGAPKTPPRAEPMRSFLRERLAALDPDEMTQLVRSASFDALPRWRFEHEGWEIDFFPIPKSPRARGKPGIRPVGMRMPEPFWSEPRLAIRDAIVEKARRYGDLDLPYIIAVNALEAGVDRIDIMEALFGKEKFTVKLTPSGPSRPQMTREPDGVWTSPSGPRHARVSAVLLASPVLPWNVPRAQICLYHNPWARRPYASELTRLPQAIPDSTTARHMEWQDGESLARIFGLHPQWPEV
jgi:hypothetical protein